MRTIYKKTNPIHTRIIELRLNNFDYSTIAEITGLSKNTVKSVCQRAGIKCSDIPGKANKDIADVGICKYCGEIFVNPWNRKGKTFCSDKCRSSWWNEQRRLGNVTKKAPNETADITVEEIMEAISSGAGLENTDETVT